MLAGTDDATRAAQGDMPSLMAHAAPPQSAANPLNSKYCQHGFIGFAGSAGCKAGLGFDILALIHVVTRNPGERRRRSRVGGPNIGGFYRGGTGRFCREQFFPAF